MTPPEKLASLLDPLSLPAWQYHPVVGSTNDLGLTWAQNGAPDGALVLADAQTAGRGRGDHQWETRAGTSLAMSLVSRPSPAEASHAARFTAWAALGLVGALSGRGMTAEIKWPNDILLGGKKVGGVLVEASWRSDALEALVVGMGVNVAPGAVPEAKKLRYPATSVTEQCGAEVDRWELLVEILQEMIAIRPHLTEDAFIDAWNAHLAFREEWVDFRLPGGLARRVKIIGVARDGRLTIAGEDGQVDQALAGDIGVFGPS